MRAFELIRIFIVLLDVKQYTLNIRCLWFTLKMYNKKTHIEMSNSYGLYCMVCVAHMRCRRRVCVRVWSRNTYVKHNVIRKRDSRWTL